MLIFAAIIYSELGGGFQDFQNLTPALRVCNDIRIQFHLCYYFPKKKVEYMI